MLRMVTLLISGVSQKMDAVWMFVIGMDGLQFTGQHREGSLLQFMCCMNWGQTRTQRTSTALLHCTGLQLKDKMIQSKPYVFWAVIFMLEMLSVFNFVFDDWR
mmetsp:Transcript_10687/g.30077  ORF Transcript_10687/g.30077 Transcript_10687/m.30077 type:complete len:103 (-) Transcript_10687:249-557(-)